MTTPNANETWEVFVGDQSPAEFLAFSTAPTAAEAVAAYVAEGPLCADLDAAEREEVARRLLAHIEAGR